MSELNRTSRTSDRRGVSKNFSLFVNTMTGASRPSCFFCPPCASMLIDQREIDRKRERERERTRFRDDQVNAVPPHSQEQLGTATAEGRVNFSCDTRRLLNRSRKRGDLKRTDATLWSMLLNRGAATRDARFCNRGENVYYPSCIIWWFETVETRHAIMCMCLLTVPLWNITNIRAGVDARISERFCSKCWMQDFSAGPRIVVFNFSVSNVTLDEHMHIWIFHQAFLHVEHKGE